MVVRINPGKIWNMIKNICKSVIEAPIVWVINPLKEMDSNSRFITIGGQAILWAWAIIPLMVQYSNYWGLIFLLGIILSITMFIICVCVKN